MGAAFFAAYALVLNVVLSGLLAASVPPAFAESEHVLCISNGSELAPQNDTGKSRQNSVIHCPLCVGHHVSGALPPPTPALARRSYVKLRTAVAFETRPVARLRSHDHQSRGPPFTI
ncbi:hypothetical protein AOQ71_23295 [Bradyrhizobium manausense]|uniref:DUF2946 domain-containing protein n=2 Tax=Bradyrhizobium manausense TaxID=989370 RepID=A0A0R3DGH7_9BRAD|nr:hypothetical protein AOQ71_23295 [Bradyrhizobium manausense]